MDVDIGAYYMISIKALSIISLSQRQLREREEEEEEKEFYLIHLS